MHIFGYENRDDCCIVLIEELFDNTPGIASSMKIRTSLLLDSSYAKEVRSKAKEPFPETVAGPTRFLQISRKAHTNPKRKINERHE